MTDDVDVPGAEPARLARAGELWTESDNLVLLDGARNGITLEEVAVDLRRTTGAVAAQLRSLLPPDLRQLPRQERLPTLSILLDDDQYDWRRVYADNLAADGRHYWHPNDEQYLRNAYEQGTPMSEVAARLRASEVQVARHAIQLGVASRWSDVAERLGCTSGGSLDRNRRLQAAADACALYVLVTHADPLPQSSGLAVSLHGTRDEAIAELVRQGVYQERIHTHAGSSTLAWTLAQRTAGDPIGRTERGQYPDDLPQDEPLAPRRLFLRRDGKKRRLPARPPRWRRGGLPG